MACVQAERAGHLDSYCRGSTSIIHCSVYLRKCKLLPGVEDTELTCQILCLTSVAATLSVLIIFFTLNSLVDADKVLIPELLWLTSIMVADLIITVCSCLLT